MAPPHSFSVTFVAEKATKNTWRFEEVADPPGSKPIIGTLYLQKSALGDVEVSSDTVVVVTVEVRP